MSRSHVVVADDDANLARSVVKKLESRGFVGHLAGDGEKALELIGKHDPVAVISEIALPGLNGFQLCRRLRDERPELSVLLFSRKSEPADEMWAAEVGAKRLVRKPDIGGLVDAVSSVVRSS